MRNYDVKNSIDVLTTGSFTGLPKIIKDTFVKPDPLSEDEIRSTLGMVNDFVLLKLISIEDIPTWLKHSKNVENAKLTLTVKDEYEIVLTLKGLDTSLPWHLITVKILIDHNNLKEDSRTILTPIQQSQLEYQAQQQLLPPHLKQYPPGIPAPEPPVNPNKKAKKSDIVALHKFLHNFCGSLILESLILQAQPLSEINWKGQLYLSQTPTSLTVHYWTSKGSPNFKDNYSSLGNSDQHTFTITLRSKVDAPLTEWKHGKMLETNPFFSKPVEDMFKVDPACINFENILLEVVRAHSVLILYTYRDIILKANRGQANFSPDQVKLFNEEGQVPYLTVDYGYKRSAKLTIDPRIGKINLTLVHDPERESIMTEVGRKLNENPENASNIMMELRFLMILDDIKSISTFCNLLPVNPITFKPGENNIFGNQVKRTLFLQFSSHSQYHLVFTATDRSVHCWIVIIELSPTTQKKTISCYKEIAINHLEEDNTDAEDIKPNFYQVPVPNISDLWDIQRLKSISQLGLDLAAYLKIGPLLTQGLAVLFNGADTNLKSFLPTLNNPANEAMFEFTPVHSSSLPSPVSGWDGAISVIQDSVNRKSVSFKIKLNYTKFPLAANPTNSTLMSLPNHWSIDVSGSYLTFTYFDLNDCWNSFVSDWSIFTHVASLTHQIYYLKWYSSFNIDINLYSCNSLVLLFQNKIHIGITWKPDSKIKTNGEYHLEFPTTSTHSRNPFTLTQPFLHAYLNRTKSLRGLIHIIRDTYQFVNGIDTHILEGKRKYSIIPRSENEIRFIYSNMFGFDLTLLKDNQIAFTYIHKIIDSDASAPKITTPAPWKPESIAPEARGTWVVSQQFKPETNKTYLDVVQCLPQLILQTIPPPNNGPSAVTTRQSGMITTSPENTFYLLLAMDWSFCNINILRFIGSWDNRETPKIEVKLDWANNSVSFKAADFKVELRLLNMCNWKATLERLPTSSAENFTNEEINSLCNQVEKQLNENKYDVIIAKGIVQLFLLPAVLIKMLIGSFELQNPQTGVSMSLKLTPLSPNFPAKVIEYVQDIGNFSLLFNLRCNDQKYVLPLTYNFFSQEISFQNNDNNNYPAIPAYITQPFEALRGNNGLSDPNLATKLQLFIQNFNPQTSETMVDADF